MANKSNKRASKQYQALFDAISAILFRYDPIGINFGANTDEYDPEARTILPRLSSCGSGADVLLVVLEEFRRWFGDDIGEDKVGYHAMADDIWRTWTEWPGRG